MPAGALLPLIRYVVMDGGAVSPGAKAYFYASGTSTPQAVYSDASLSTAYTQPVEADADGVLPPIYFQPLNYRVTITTSAGVTIFPATDNVYDFGQLSTMPVGTVLATFQGNDFSPVTDTSYPSGAGIDKIHYGTSVYRVDAANVTGTYALRGLLKSVGGVTVTAALVNLSTAPDTPLVTIASTDTTGELVTSSAITFGSSGTTYSYAIKCKVSGGSGFGWGFSIVRTA